MKYLMIAATLITLVAGALTTKAAQFDATMDLLAMLDEQIKTQNATSQKEIQELERAAHERVVKVEKEQAKVDEKLQALATQANAKELDRKSLEKTLKQIEKLRDKAERAIGHIEKNFTNQENFMDQKNQQLLEAIAGYLETSIETVRDILKKDRDNDLRSFLKAKKRQNK